jgi:hypothetical protein
MSSDKSDVYETTVEDLTTVADTYPGLPEPLVERDFLLQSIEEQLEDLDALFLDWPEGGGKTTLLTQFFQRNAHRTISLFIGAPWSYQPDAVKKDICNQIHWVLNTEELRSDRPTAEEFDVESLQNRYFRKLNRRGRRGNPFYFVVDGIEDIPPRDRHAQDEILEGLPFDAPGIKFILSGKEDILRQNLLSKIKTDSLGTILFSETETREYLGDLVEDNRKIEELRETCRSLPGRLAAVRRILERGATAESILRLDVDDAGDLFEVEWESVQGEEDRRILALIAFNNLELDVDEISRILKIPLEKVSSCTDRLSFIRRDEQNRTLQYVSASFQRYAKRRLSDLESSVRDSMVDHLIDNMESDRSLRHLPSLLSEASRHQELLEILSPEYFYRILNRDQSLGTVNQIADLAHEAADLQRDWGAITRFSLHRSSVTELWVNHAKRSEVEALMALGDLEGAMALADTALSHIERLHLLSIIARVQKKQGENVDGGLLERIRRLAEEVDASDLKNRAEEIGTDLISVDPELALRLVEQGAEAGSGEHSLDVAYLKMSFAEAAGSQGSMGGSMSSPSTLEDVQSRIQDPDVRQISSKLSLLLGDYSASKVIEEAKTFEKTGDRLYFLRLWTQSHQRSEDAGAVIEYALKQVIQNVNYAHDAGLLRGLAEPLPYLKSNEQIKKLVDVFDQQKQSSLLVEELVRLEITLARAEAQFDLEAADDRLINLYLDLEEVEDLATQTEGWARLMAVLPLTETPTSDEQSILEQTADDLEKSTSELLSKSADQIDATRHVIRGLASNRPDLALDLADRLNTENRRDQATVEFLKAYLNNPLDEVDVGDIFQAIQLIESAPAHRRALSEIFDRLSAEQDDIQTAAKYVKQFSGEVGNIYDADKRCEVAIQGYSVVSRAHQQVEANDSESAHDLLEEAKESFEALDDRFDKIKKAFHISAQLADIDRETALSFKEKAEGLQSRISLESKRSRNSFFASLDLTIRTYRGLIIGGSDEEEDLSRILNLIEKMTSLGDKITCLSDLAFSFFRGERMKEGRDLVQNRIRPLLNRISSGNQRKYFDLWSYAAPPLYMAGSKQTLEELEQNLPAEYRDYALSNIADAVLDKVMPADPVDSDPNRNCQLRTEEIYELVEILGHIETDYLTYKLLEEVIDTVLEDEGRRTYDRSFRINLENKLREIATNSFPHSKYIQHNGYLILSKSDLLLLKNTYKNVRLQDWLNLLDEARSIDNEADRALVLSKLVEKCPSSKGSAREHQLDVLDEVESIIKEFPSVLDRLDRFESLAQAAKEVDRGRARTYHKEAIRLLYAERENVDTSKGRKIQRRIMSSAYRIDPDFASSLSNLADDDPAHQQELERNLKRLRRRESISTGDGNDHREQPDPDFPNVCWESLGSLNAGRLPGVRKDRAKDMLEQARKYPLEDAYPIQTFIIEGLVDTYQSAKESSRIIRPVFEANLENAHLVERLALRSSEKQDLAKAQATRQEGQARTFNIGRGDRDEALRILKEWVGQQVTERLIICDQYFGPGQIDALSLIQSVVPDCEIEILSSEKHHRQNGVENLREAYIEAWREKYDQEMPTLRIVVAGIPDEGMKSPIHDRWWITTGSGLRLGTSFNGLGQGQTSEISVMDDAESEAKMEEVEQYLSTRAREIDGSRISYRVANI